MLLAAPASLPLLALFAARRREAARLEAAAAAADVDADVADALADLRADLAAAAAAPARALRAVDTKMGALQASVDGAAASARGAAAAADSVGAKVSRATAAALADAVGGLRRALATDLAPASAPTDSRRLAAVEAALAQLTAAQAAAAPTLARAVAAALDDVVEAVRDEVAAGLEAAVAAPRGGGRRGGGSLSPSARLLDNAVDAEVDDAPSFPPNAVLATATPSPGGLTPADRDWLEARLRSLATALDGAAAARDADAADALAALAAAERPGALEIEPSQWAALGRRLAAIEAGLTDAGSGGLDEVREDLAAVRTVVAALPPSAVDLTPLETALASMSDRIDTALAAGDALSDGLALLKRVEARVERLAAPPPPSPDRPAAQQATKEQAYAAMQQVLASRNNGVEAEGGRVVAASPAASPPRADARLATPAPAPEPADAPDTIKSLMATGASALRDGRALLARGGADAAASRALATAVAAFEAAAAADPANVKALGNWGNALAAQGTLAAGEASAAAARGDAAAAADAESAADAAWVAAGDRYRRVAELAPGDGRALGNWARALAARARLPRVAPAAAERLLESAATKLDAVLAANPGDGRSAREAGLVLEALAAARPPGSSAEADTLRNALACLADARSLDAPDANGAAAAAGERVAARLAELGGGGVGGGGGRW